MSDPSPGPGRRVRTPSGESFRVLERAGPVELVPAPPVAAEAGRADLVVARGGLFVVSDRDGDIGARGAVGEGVYAHDTRFLNELRLTVSGRPPVGLSSSAESGFEAFIDLTTPETDEVPQMTLNVRRHRLVDDHVYERIELRNHGRDIARGRVEVRLAADFADIFDVRGFRQGLSRGELLEPKRSASGVTFGYLGEDGLFRRTRVSADPKPQVSLDGATATLAWSFDLEPRSVFAVDLSLMLALHDDVSPDARGIVEARHAAQSRFERWSSSCTRITGSQREFDRVIAASVRDLSTLALDFDGERILAAGVPWYAAPFGRDSLLTSYECLLLNPAVARDCLLFLAARQAISDDADRDAEPGKILHELRVGELAHCGYIPHTPYYGSVDATPLFVMLAASYHRWTADTETLHRIRAAIESALEWMDSYGDRDGDGFLEYERRSPAGLHNQGWKDSEDAIVHADGSLARGPIALCEVQAYAYLARLRIAEVFDAFGDSERAEALRAHAARLKQAFNDAFWLEDEGTFALGLDGNKRQIRSVTSNAGHCLYCGIADDGKGRRVASRLMAQDMFSGWGVRTLSSESPAYNPLSYHNGSVWPHDNAVVASGFKRYGALEATERVVAALFEAALASREARLPELICGFRRRPDNPYVPYPVACRPQAWAAAAPFMILQALLGISARAPEGVLAIHDPVLPEWLTSVDLLGLRVGAATVSLSFTRSQGHTAVSVLERHGDIAVQVHQ